jgi:predicted transcriptional regulator
MTPKVKTWIANVKNGKIKTNTERILNTIYVATLSEKKDIFSDFSGRISTDELRVKLNISHQTLTAILSGLQDEGVIYVAGEKDCGSEFYSYWSFTSDPSRMNKLIQERKNEKFTLWLKRGVHEFPDLLPEEILDFFEQTLGQKK